MDMRGTMVNDKDLTMIRSRRGAESMAMLRMTADIINQIHKKR